MSPYDEDEMMRGFWGWLIGRGKKSKPPKRFAVKYSWTSDIERDDDVADARHERFLRRKKLVEALEEELDIGRVRVHERTESTSATIERLTAQVSDAEKRATEAEERVVELEEELGLRDSKLQSLRDALSL